LPFCGIILKELILVLLSVWKNSAVKPSGPGLYFLRTLFIPDSISLLVIVLFTFFISS
jgi:hypothetical protein